MTRADRQPLVSHGGGVVGKVTAVPDDVDAVVEVSGIVPHVSAVMGRDRYLDEVDTGSPLQAAVPATPLARPQCRH